MYVNLLEVGVEIKSILPLFSSPSSGMGGGMAVSGADFLTSKMLEASEPSLPEDSLMVLVGGGGLGGFGLGGLGLSSSPPSCS